MYGKKKNVILAIYLVVLFLTTLSYCFFDVIVADEAWTIRFSHMKNWDMIAATAADVHPPLYYMIVRVFFLIGGENYILYHIVSLIPYGIILLFAFCVVKKEFGYLSAIVLVTCNTVMNCAYTYNTQIRMYSWAELFVLLSFYELYLILKKDETKNYILFVLFSLCAAYTHYYALISVAFFYLALYLFAIKQKDRWKKVVISSAVTFVVYLPWLFVLIKSFQRTVKEWWSTDIPSIMTCVYFVCENKYILLFFLLILGMYVLYECNALSLKLSGQIQFRIKKFDWTKNVVCQSAMETSEEPRCFIKNMWLATGLASLMGTCAIGLLLSYLIRPLFIARYLFPVAGVFWLVIGICMERLPGKKIWIVVFAVLMLHFCVPAYKADYVANQEMQKNTVDFMEKVDIGRNGAILTDIFDIYYMADSYYYKGVQTGCITIGGEIAR